MKTKKITAAEIGVASQVIDKGMANLTEREQLCDIPALFYGAGQRDAHILVTARRHDQNVSGSNYKALVNTTVTGTGVQVEQFAELIAFLAQNMEKAGPILDFLKSQQL